MSSITTNNLKHDLYDLTLKFRPEERETLNKIDAVYVAWFLFFASSEYNQPKRLQLEELPSRGIYSLSSPFDDKNTPLQLYIRECYWGRTFTY